MKIFAALVFVFLLTAPISVAEEVSLNSIPEAHTKDWPAWKQSIYKKLGTPCTVEFIDTPLKVVAKQLSQRTGLSIRLAVEDQEEIALEQPDDEESPAVTLTAKDMPLRDLLQWACRLTETDYTWDKSGLLLGHIPMATRAYNVLDLTEPETELWLLSKHRNTHAACAEEDLVELYDAFQAAPLDEIILNRFTGAFEDGRSGCELDDRGHLTVTHSLRTHDRIQSFLTLLRGAKDHLWVETNPKPEEAPLVFGIHDAWALLQPSPTAMYSDGELDVSSSYLSPASIMESITPDKAWDEPGGVDLWRGYLLVRGSPTIQNQIAQYIKRRRVLCEEQRTRFRKMHNLDFTFDMNFPGGTETEFLQHLRQTLGNALKTAGAPGLEIVTRRIEACRFILPPLQRKGVTIRTLIQSTAGLLDTQGDFEMERGFREETGPAELRENARILVFTLEGYASEKERRVFALNGQTGQGMTRLLRKAWMATQKAWEVQTSLLGTDGSTPLLMVEGSPEAVEIADRVVHAVLGVPLPRERKLREATVAKLEAEAAKEEALQEQHKAQAKLLELQSKLLEHQIKQLEKKKEDK